MNAGRLKYIIIIQSPEITQNEYGANSINWIDKIIARSDFQNNSGNRVNENGEIIFSYEKIFTIRYYHNINERDRIKFGNDYYRILSLEKEKDKQFIKINTELIND